MDTEKFLINFHDYLAPKLDTYEQAIYLYIVRHSRLINQDEALIGFKSARKKFAFGAGKAGTPMSEGVIYKKLQSLEEKQCIKIMNSEYKGTRIKCFLPSEINGLVKEEKNNETILNIDEIDFFNEPTYRKYILEREQYQCFYCQRQLDDNNYVLEHVISRPKGDNSYKNLVASCRTCNNKKGDKDVQEFIRVLYRNNFLSDEEFNNVNKKLKLLKSGDLKPKMKG